MNTILLKIYQFFTTTTIVEISIGRWLKIIFSFLLLVIGIKDSHHLTIWIALLFIVTELNVGVLSKRSSKIRNEE
ncbi:hypothetical protein L1283_002647 [Sphingobacterium sp. HSC-15S19]